MVRQASMQANKAIDKSIQEHERLAKKIAGIEKSQFRIYKPLYAGMRKTSLLSLLSNFFTMVRRLILLYIAMFMEEQSWLQVGMFTMLSFASLVYLGYTRPYKSRQQNRLNIFNEQC